MSDLEMWSLVVSFFLPLAIAVAQQPRMTGLIRVVVMVIFCVMAAGVTTALKGELEWGRWFHSLLVMAVGTIAFYRGFWHPAGAAPAIEHKTSPAGKHSSDP